MNLIQNNLLGAVTELRNKGYEDEYVLKDDYILSVSTGSILKNGDFEIENGFQFEIPENAIDSQFLFILKETENGKKGLIIDLLGTDYYSDKPIATVLQVPLQVLVNKEEPELKYGMRKVFKSEFNEDPARYELRMEYPDFPACPFGNSFSMLGYDKQNEEYVWLVTSIIRDERLKRVKH